jgi:predicted dehydrogenase
MKKIKIAHLGLGKRGSSYIKPFLELEEYELVGVCDRTEAQLEQCQKNYGLSEEMMFSDLENMLAKTKPDVLCFVTNPSIKRLPIVEKAAEYGVKGIIFEKPAANTLEEIRAIKDICEKKEIKAVVCHQMKYAQQFKMLKEYLQSDKLGKPYEINLSCPIVANITQVFTHGLDLLLWLNDYDTIDWVTGHMNGPSNLDGQYPSPEYICGRLKFKNGLYTFFESGSHANKYIYEQTDNIAEISLMIYGEKGQGYANMSGDWKISTDQGECICKKEPAIFEVMNYDLHFPFLKDFALWMNDDTKVHSSNVSNAYKISAILEAIYLSSAQNKRVDIDSVEECEGKTIELLRKNL